MMNMKKLLYLMAISLFAACTNDEIINTIETVEIGNADELSDGSVVSSLNATGVATAFWSDFNGTTRADIDNLEYDLVTIYSEDTPQMYVFNFKEGGFVLVSATKEFYPILAYSEDGTFPVGEEKEGLKMWLDDTKYAISNCDQQADSIKAAFRMMWGKYEMQEPYTAASSRATTRMTVAEQVLLQRLEYYYRLTSGSGGWNFRPLSQAASAFAQYGLSEEYQSLCNRAQNNNSDLDETLIGWRVIREGDTYGPFLNTAWHQDSPFNDYLSNEAGCGAIAVSQLMKYYEYPATFTLNGTTYNWDNIPNYESSNSDQAALVRYAYNKINSKDGALDTGIGDFVYTTPGDLRDGLRSMGYNVTRQNHNSNDVIGELRNGRPVIMLGNEDNYPDWGNVAYFNNSHYWICDGVNDVEYYLEYFTEWQPYSSGTMESGWYSLESPNRIESNNNYRSFHMNWGWGDSGGNGWFLGDSVNPGNRDYRYNRDDFLVSVPE